METKRLKQADRAYAAAEEELAAAKDALTEARRAVDDARSERQRQVIEAREAGGTWKAIGEVLGVSHVRVIEIAKQGAKRAQDS